MKQYLDTKTILVKLSLGPTDLPFEFNLTVPDKTGPDEIQKALKESDLGGCPRRKIPVFEELTRVCKENGWSWDLPDAGIIVWF